MKVAFSRNKVVNDFVLPLIDEDRIHYNSIILSELLIGATTEKEFNFLKSNFDGFKYLETDKNIFKKASRVGFRLRREGHTLSPFFIYHLCTVNSNSFFIGFCFLVYSFHIRFIHFNI